MPPCNIVLRDWCGIQEGEARVRRKHRLGGGLGHG